MAYFQLGYLSSKFFLLQQINCDRIQKLLNVTIMVKDH